MHILDVLKERGFIAQITFEEELYKQLKTNGILVRYFNKERIKDFIRITIGTEEQMNKFLTEIDSILEKAGK